MPSTYIPRRDSELNNWLGNFAARIAADPPAYGLSDADAAELSAAVAAWETAYFAAIAPETRTRPTVLAKDQQRKAVLRTARRLAAVIRPDDSISSALKIGLGLHVPAIGPDGETARPTLSHAPETTPVLAILRINAGSQELRATDSGSRSRLARPKNAAGLLVFRTIADTPATHATGAEFLGFITRPTFTSAFENRAAARGKTATYFARWVGRTGELGPWSQPVSTPIAA